MRNGGDSVDRVGSERLAVWNSRRLCSSHHGASHHTELLIHSSKPGRIPSMSSSTCLLILPTSQRSTPLAGGVFCDSTALVPTIGLGGEDGRLPGADFGRPGGLGCAASALDPTLDTIFLWRSARRVIRSTPKWLFALPCRASRLERYMPADSELPSTCLVGEAERHNFCVVSKAFAQNC